MKPEALVFGLCLAAPFVCSLIVKSTATRIALSVFASMVLMSWCLMIGETRAPYPDFDIVFGIYFTAWSLLAMLYGIVVPLCLYGIGKLIKCFKKRDLLHEK